MNVSDSFQQWLKDKQEEIRKNNTQEDIDKALAYFKQNEEKLREYMKPKPTDNEASKESEIPTE